MKNPGEERRDMNHIHENEDYGWLSPAGRFYPVGWSQHDSWAKEHIDELIGRENLSLKERISSAGMGDVLMNRGWVLLHNPRRGLAFPTKKPEKRYTKAQADFLYEYYIERGEHDRANEVIE